MTSDLPKQKQSLEAGFSFFRMAFFILPILGVVVPYGLPLWLAITAFLGMGILFIKNPSQKKAFQSLINRHCQKKALSLTVLFMAGCLVFSAWMGITTFWSPNFYGSIRLFLSLNILFFAGLTLGFLLHLFDRHHLRFLGFSFFLGCLFVLLFLTVDLYFTGSVRYFLKTGKFTFFSEGSGLMPYNQGATFLAVIIWPLLGLVYRWKRLLILPFIVIIPCLLLQLKSHAAIVALIVGAFVFLCVYSLRKPALILGSLLTFVIIVTSPQLSVHFLDPVKLEKTLPRQAKASYSHRLWIWRYVSHRAFEKPILGWGLDASRNKEFHQSMLWHSQRFCLEKGQKGDIDSCANESLPLHPHNMALQLWLELGIIGTVLAALLVSLLPLIVAYCPVSRFGKALAASAYASSLVIGFVAYGIWQNWWVATLMIGLALTGWLLKIEKTRKI